MFGEQTISQKTDEMIFGIFSIYEMSEFISSNLKILRKSMKDFISMISNKV